MDTPDIATVGKALFDEFEGLLTWKWDDWVGTILAEFGVTQKKDIRSLLEKHLPVAFDIDSIEDAPAIVRALDDQLGGIRSGQLLFSSDPSQESFVFGAWWPWGDGETISIRIAPYDRRLSEAEEAKLIEQMKTWAGI